MNNLYNIFLLVVFIVKLPPLYYLPFESRLATSHSLARIVLVILTIAILYKNRTYLRQFTRKYRILFIFLLLYLFGQSVSILSAQDLTLFFKGYLNVVSYIILFIVWFLFSYTIYINIYYHIYFNHISWILIFQPYLLSIIGDHLFLI